jgi:hypothetical protein
MRPSQPSPQADQRFNLLKLTFCAQVICLGTATTTLAAEPKPKTTEATPTVGQTVGETVGETITEIIIDRQKSTDQALAKAPEKAPEKTLGEAVGTVVVKAVAQKEAATQLKSAQPPTPNQQSQPEAIAAPPESVTPTPKTVAPKTVAPKTIAQSSIAPIITTGISVKLNGRTYERSAGASIRGAGDGATREEFEQWLMPLETVLEALQIKSRKINDRELELTSKFAATRLDLNTITNDPELGLVVSVKQIEDLLKIPANFDLQESAIVFDLPNTNTAQTARAKKELFLDGLPVVNSPGFSLGMVEQRVTASGTTTQSFRPQGTLLTVGNLLGGSWYAELRQNKVLSPRDWQLNSLQFLRQSPQRDLFVGSHPTFWRGTGSGDFWGVTTIGRQGFSPDMRLDTRGGADPAARLQPSFVNASVNGYAEPGTLVRLMRGGEGGVLVAEQVTDTDGRYEFRNIAVGRDADSGTSYELLLYPQGQLSATPRIERPRFILLPEQLPAGTSSQIISAGWRRRQVGNDFFGGLGEMSGGLSQRWGISESLTLGLGAVYDNKIQGIGELFFQPKGTPFRFAATGLLSGKSDVQLGAAWEDYPNLSAQWTYTGSKHSYNVDFPMPMLKPFRFNFYGDSDRGSYWGLQFSQGYRGGSTYGRLVLQPSGRLNWDVYQNFNRLNFSHRKIDTGTNNYASYRVNRNSSVVFEYNTLNALNNLVSNRRNGQLFNAFWRYQSSNYQIDGLPMWGLELGYGVSNVRSGPYASVTTSVIPGLFFQAKYQGASMLSDAGQFSLSLVSSMGTQSGFYAGNRRLDEMRSQGGLMVQAFMDKNANGKRDQGEELYSESTDYLKVNHDFLESHRMEKHQDRVLVRLLPGQYRVDLDPAGFPMEFQPTATALAVNVTEGGYTPVLIPLQPVYALSGVITKPNGQPANGVRIEAIDKTSQKSQFTLTNTAGVYYLESLRRGQYEIRVDGQPIANQAVQLTEQSEPMQEINFTMTEITSKR